MINIKFNVLILFQIFTATKCANILFIATCVSPSHQIWNYELAEGLFLKGHNVTLLGPTSLDFEGHKNYHPISTGGHESFPYDPAGLVNMNPYDYLLFMHEYGTKTCIDALQSAGLDILLDYPKDYKFDLIILDATVDNCCLPLTQRFNYPPTVYVTAFLLPPYLSEALGNPVATAYLPHYYLKYGEKMNFIERLNNFFWSRLEMVVRHYSFYKDLETLARKKFGEHMESLDVLERHVSFLLCHLVPGYHNSQPLPPNIIPVGGLHIKPAKTLPPDIQKIMDNAEDGAILFSLGTNVDPTKFGEEKLEMIIEAIGKLKQIVLWKFTTDIKVPKNIIIRKWLPQREILAHPNLKVFITHGGALSTTEASYFGVPLVVLPFMVDQHINAKLIVDKQLGIKIDFNSMTSKTVFDAINEVLTNSVYTSNMKKMSEIVKDQPQTPMERAIFWLEFAIRHNGTHLLDPLSREMPLYVTLSLDIYLFCLVIIVAFIFIIIYILLYITKSIFRNAPKKQKIN